MFQKESSEAANNEFRLASNMNEQHKLLQEAAAAAAAAARSSSSPVMTPTSVASAVAASPYLAALAAASSQGSPTSAAAGYPRLPLPANLPQTASTEPNWMMNPLIQAALRQQQLQWFNQIASLSGSPFMNPLAMASLSGQFPGAAAASTPPMPPLIPATSSSESKESSSPVTTSSNSLDNVYREYLSKIVDNGGQKSEAVAAAEVMANLIKANTEDTNGNSKSKLFEPTQQSPKNVSPPTGTTQATPPRPRANGGTPSSNYNGKDKVFTCKTCNRSFGYKHVLQNHERTHTGEKPFECKVCHKRFTRDHHLKTHMRLHTGEKPYSCTHCDRQFVQVANLRRHLRVHTGERPYKCEVCESCFSDSNQLKAHILIHKGEKPFVCTKCDGKFRRRHHLMHHVCPMVPGSSQVNLPPVDPSESFDEDDSDERFILAAKRARSASMKEGMYEDSAPSLLAQLSSPTPSNLELSLMLAQARAAQERALRQLESPPSAQPTSATAVTQQPARSRKNRDPKRLNPSASPSDVEELPQSEPEDLSSKKEDVNLDLLAITTSEVTGMNTATAATLSQMPIANK